MRDVTPNDITALVADEVPESVHLDYKQALPGETDSERKDFVKDVAKDNSLTGSVRTEPGPGLPDAAGARLTVSAEKIPGSTRSVVARNRRRGRQKGDRCRGMGTARLRAAGSGDTDAVAAVEPEVTFGFGLQALGPMECAGQSLVEVVSSLRIR